MAVRKDAFWHALVFTIFIFAAGLFIGFIFENSRVNTVEEQIYSSEISLLDQQIRTMAISNFNISCTDAKKELFSFADRVYDEALRLENYDGASKFMDVLPILHKRYDLLRVLIWTEGIKINEKCPDKFHRVVYFYSYSSEDAAIIGTQAFYARLLSDVKEKLDEDLLLIPIAVNTNVSSVDLLVREHGITQFPAILIDEQMVITEIPTAEELESLILKNSN